MSGKPGRSGPPVGNTNSVRHGHYARLKALESGRWDKRTREYKAITAKVRDYSKSLGPSMSPQKAALVRDAAEIQLILSEPLTVYLAGLKNLVRKGKPNAAVELRLRLSAQLADLLTRVGLDKVRHKPTLDNWLRRQGRRRTKTDPGALGGRQ